MTSPEQHALETEPRLADIAAADARNRRAIRHARIAVVCGCWALVIALGGGVWMIFETVSIGVR